VPGRGRTLSEEVNGRVTLQVYSNTSVANCWLQSYVSCLIHIKRMCNFQSNGFPMQPASRHTICRTAVVGIASVGFGREVLLNPDTPSLCPPPLACSAERKAANLCSVRQCGRWFNTRPGRHSFERVNCRFLESHSQTGNRQGGFKPSSHFTHLSQVHTQTYTQS
jgi:hypothetical protein